MKYRNIWKKTLISFLFLISWISTMAQLTVDTTFTAVQLANMLAGDGITISNVAIDSLPGDSTSPGIGRFSYEGEILPENGIVLVSGQAYEIPDTASIVLNSGLSGTNITTLYADTFMFTGHYLADLVLFQFDVVAEHAALNLRFQFASDEYPVFVCTDVDEFAAILLSGPGINGPYIDSSINIARVPGKDVYVGINTINAGVPGDHPTADAQYCLDADTDWTTNSEYFIDNTYGSHVAFSGMTVTLETTETVIPGLTYHVRFLIANHGDGFRNSAIFLEAGGLTSSDEFPVGSTEVDMRPEIRTWVDENGQMLIDAGSRVISSVRIFDMQGKLMQQFGSYEKGGLDLGSLPAGIYVIQLGMDGRQHYSRIVKH